ncbi:hypothetical protein IAR55_001674 [Kwoniella newhampshirensis]|uniref:DUF7729 domain-containing protein n=1 Tax=Kwoniella newhampshirensis TaxID=1651941 RepID=A0AAW0Z2T8_9TREE
MHVRSALIALVATTSSAVALSTGCTGQIGGLALGDLGNCLRLTNLLPVLGASGSIVPALNTYLASLCSSDTPTCSNATLSSAQSSLTSDCASDISGGGTNAAEVGALVTLIHDYPQVYAAACSRNSTTGDYCLSSTLSTIQNTTGTEISVSFVTGLLSGSNSSTSSLQQVFQSGGLCTQCVSGLYYEALQANSSIAGSTIGQGLTSTCGAEFGTTAPNTTSTNTANTTTSSTPASSSAASSGFVAAPFAGLANTAMISGSLLGAVLLGAVAVL